VPLPLDLPPGAKLVFTENAKIFNEYSLGKQTLLNVRMLGGTLDDSALDLLGRTLIRRWYPEPSVSFRDNLRLFPNPFAEFMNLSYLAGNEEVLQLTWVNLSGQTVLSETLRAQKGMNEWQPEAPSSAGMYLLEIAGKSGRTIQKVVCSGR